MDQSGLYIVEPLSTTPTSVNANDPRMAARCLMVTRGFIKVGRAANLARRERGYWKVFGRENVRFRPLALLEDTRVAERAILQALDPYRQRNPFSGRRTEWLLGIDAERASAAGLARLQGLAMSFQWVWAGQPEAPAHRDQKAG